MLTGKLGNARSTTPNASTSITGFNLLQDVYKVNPENGENGPLALNDYSVDDTPNIAGRYTCPIPISIPVC